MRREGSFPLLLLCFFLSGLAALIYETAWTREFAFVFGTSNLAVATVLAAYMAGLAAGAAAAARFADRVRRPVLAYGILELGIALAALAVPVAIRASRSLYVALFGGGGLPDAGGVPTGLFYLVCSFLILMVPTAMMGATLPLLARHAVRREEEIGSRIGLLYSANTAGAVAGTLAAAFLLLPAFGLRQTIWIAAGVNGVVFLAAWGLARSAGPMASAESAAAPSPTGRALWILPLIFASGAVSFTYEVLWVRLLSHVIGGSVYAFATMLASFLTGIALGSAIASRLATTRARGALGFAITQLGIAALSLAAFAGVSWLPELAATLQRQGYPRGVGAVAAGALTLLPAAVCIGATFPLAVRVLARSQADAGAASARVYAANTFGSIVGSVGAGFVLIPALGHAATLGLCVAINLLLAAGAALLLAPRNRALAAVATAGLALLWLFPPATPWRVLRASFLNLTPAAGELTYFGVGRAATVLLLARDGEWHLRTNGLPEASIQPPGSWRNRTLLARWLGALPALARPEARSMLIVGLGGGTAVESVPDSFERIDVVELEDEVVAANRAVGPLRWRDPLADPRVHLHVNDARNALLLSDKRFDAIVSQPSHPWSSGAAHLYTQEFFRLARSRLAEDGVFVQWIGLSFVDEALFRSLLATLSAEFRYVRVYAPPPTGGVLFLASNSPLDVEESSRRALEAAPADLRELGIELPADVTAWLLLDEEGARALAQGAPLNRDDHNHLQNRSPRILARPLGGGVIELSAPFDPLRRRATMEDERFYLLRTLPAQRGERLLPAFGDPTARRVAEGLVAIRAGDASRARRSLRDALGQEPGHAEARAALLGLAQVPLTIGQDPLEIVDAPLTPEERAVTSGWRAVGQQDVPGLRALEDGLAAIPPEHPLSLHALRLRAEWRVRSGDPARAREGVALADRALKGLPLPRDLLLRARASAAAGDGAAALSTLIVLGQQLGGQAPLQRRRIARQGLELAQSLAPEPGLEPLRTRAVERLGGGRR